MGVFHVYKRTRYASDVSAFPCIAYTPSWTPNMDGKMWIPFALVIHIFNRDFKTINKFKVRHYWGTQYPDGNFYPVDNSKWHDAARIDSLYYPNGSNEPRSGMCIRRKDFNQFDKKLSIMPITYAAFQYLMDYPKRALILHYKTPKGTSPINNKRNPIDERPTNFYKLSDYEPYKTIVNCEGIIQSEITTILTNDPIDV